MLSLTEYALAQTYRILSPNRNRRTARCHGCGEVLAVDCGREVYQQGWFAGRAQTRYLCRKCFGVVKEACEAVMAADKTGSPEWWGELERGTRTKEERVVPRPSGAELDLLIAEREGEVNGE